MIVDFDIYFLNNNISLQGFTIYVDQRFLKVQIDIFKKPDPEVQGNIFVSLNTSNVYKFVVGNPRRTKFSGIFVFDYLDWVNYGNKLEYYPWHIYLNGIFYTVIIPVNIKYIGAGKSKENKVIFEVTYYEVQP